jgi:hypothetical protein
VAACDETADEPSRAEFRDRHIDLLIWRRGELICGFELRYGINTDWERTIRWTMEEGVMLLKPAAIDTPLMIEASEIIPPYLLEEFAIRSRTLEDDARSCVMRQMTVLRERILREDCFVTR